VRKIAKIWILKEMINQLRMYFYNFILILKI